MPYPSPPRTRHGRFARIGAGLLCVALILLLPHAPSRAQTPSAVPAYPLRLSLERARALVEAAERRLPYIPGEVLIKFRPGMSLGAQNRALASLRSRPSASALRWSGDVAVLRDESEPDSAVLAATLSRQPEVLYAAPNRLHRLTSEPNDPGYAARQWNLKAIDMPRVWDINPGAAESVTIAVVDSGITTVNENFVFPTWNGSAFQNFTARFAVNPDLAATRLVSSADLAFWDGPVLDTVGHGTHVSGTLAEDTNNSVGEAGIAYRARVMPVKVCVGYWEVQFVMSASGQPGYAPLDVGGCPDDLIAEGIRYAADHGAQVINVSLGGPGAAQVLADALTYAVSKGSFVALSAGNSFESGNPPDYPATYADAIDGVMSVAAVGPSLTRAYYSSTTSKVEIAAPGGNSREGGSNAKVWQMSLLDSDANPATVVFPRFDRYTEVALEGTSMATPHVAALAALLYSQGIKKPAAIEAIIKATARDLGPAGRDDETGYGLIQPRVALRGFGATR